MKAIFVSYCHSQMPGTSQHFKVRLQQKCYKPYLVQQMIPMKSFKSCTESGLGPQRVNYLLTVCFCITSSVSKDSIFIWDGQGTKHILCDVPCTPYLLHVIMISNHFIICMYPPEWMISHSCWILSASEFNERRAFYNINSVSTLL